jgi:hypothetical protein
MGARITNAPTMQTAIKSTMPWIIAAVAVSAFSCSKEEPKPEAAPVKSAPKPAPSPPPPPKAEKPPEPPKPAIECPEGSKGEGTFNNPCEATGNARAMEVTWTGKIDDKGPFFRVINKTKSVILYGKIAVYFYDKAGKQLEVPALGGASDKTKPFHTCGGNMFGGVMKPGEKAVLQFSCVKKERVPEDTKAIEAEMPMVGFADANEKTVESYWRNNDLTPEARKKGGAKK